MAKYMSRIQFEQMKVLKKRGASNVATGKALGISPATVSRNNKYNSYEDYLVSMYGRNSKSQKEVEAKSGPVRIVSSGKKVCKKCGKTKLLEEFDLVKQNKDGRSGMCKECRRKKQRQYKRVLRSAKPEPNGCYGHVACLPTLFPTSTERPAATEDEDDDDEIRINECVYVDINDKVKRGVVIAINDVSYTPEYIVRLDTRFFRKEVRVNQCHIFRRGDV